MRSSIQPQSTYQFDLSGGRLCLDFANTVSGRAIPEQAVDHLRSYEDLVAFARQSEALTSPQCEELQALARRKNRLAETALRRALDYRELMFRAFAALAEGAEPETEDLQSISDLALEALTHRQLKRADGQYQWHRQWDRRDALDCILWLIAESAADLLTSAEVKTVRMCEAPECAWLFLDQSRNRTRRWCDMKVCGNRQKARRHYRRTHL